MELYQLKSFAAVAQTCSVTRAAEKLNTTPPSVSNHIRQIEEELDICLFTRTSKGMFITSQGISLLDQAKTILAETQRFHALADSLKNQISGELTLAINSTPQFLKIPQIIETVHKLYPKLKLELVLSSTGNILTDIENKKIDCGYAFGPLKENSVASMFIAGVNLVVAIPARFNVEPGIHAEDLAALPWVVPDNLCPFLSQVSQYFAENGIRLDNKIFCNDDITKFALVEKGAAVCVMEKSEARPYIKAGTAMAWEAPVTFENRLSFVYSADQAGDLLIRTMVDVVRQVWDIVPDAAGAQVNA